MLIESTIDVKKNFLESFTEMNLTKRKIVLLDDDPAFCNIMASFARSRGLELDYFFDLQEMGSIGKLSDYAVAIIDYDLGQINGIEIAEYLPIFFESMPMVLISSTTRECEPTKPWPNCVKQFVHKDFGPDEILNIASELLPKRKNQKSNKELTYC